MTGIRIKRKQTRLKTVPSGMRLRNEEKDVEVDARLMEGPNAEEEYLVVKTHYVKPESEKEHGEEVDDMWYFYGFRLTRQNPMVASSAGLTESEAYRVFMESLENFEKNDHSKYGNQYKIDSKATEGT